MAITAKPAGNRHARRAAAAKAGKPHSFAAAFGMESPAEDEEAKKARRAEEDKQKEGESDEDYASRKAEQEKARKAEDEKDEREASEEEDGTEAETADDEKCAVARAEGFAAGNARWAETLASAEAKGKGMQAVNLLGSTDMTGEQIRKALTVMQPDAKPAAGGVPLDRRMQTESPAAPAASAAPKPVNERGMITSQAVIAAAAEVRGEKPATS